MEFAKYYDVSKINVKDVRILKHGMSTVVFHSMNQRKRNSLEN